MARGQHNLDESQAGAAAERAESGRQYRDLRHFLASRAGCLLSLSQQGASLGDIALALVIAQKPVVTNFDKALGQ